VAAFLLYGCVALYRFVTAGWWTNILFEFPVADMPIRIAHGVSIAVFALGALGCYVLALNRPRVADFLIEVESEMYKVAWPSSAEWRGSSVVVIVSILLMGAFLFAVDQLLGLLMRAIGF
jgi:preprotein translocase subunit SecE